jgi:hypothetical protein
MPKRIGSTNQDPKEESILADLRLVCKASGETTVEASEDFFCDPDEELCGLACATQGSRASELYHLIDPLRQAPMIMN